MMTYWFLFLPVVFVILVICLLFRKGEIGWKIASFSPRVRTPLKTGALFLAFFSAGLALSGLRYEKKVNSATYVFCFDITLSQAVEDYFEKDKPVPRLDVAKNFVRGIITTLPAGSLVAICAYHGVNANVDGYMLLLPPIRKERTYAIEKALEMVDWRNAWKDGSTLAYAPLGLFKILRKFKGPFNVIILGDGENDLSESEPQIKMSPVRRFVEQSRFLLVGVGKTTLSKVPEYDREGKKSAECLYHYTKEEIKCYMSRLDEEQMIKAAQILGGKYYKIEDKEAIKKWLYNPKVGKGTYTVEASYDWIFEMAAVVFIIIWILI